VPGAGPMGKRQTAPLDANLVTQYTLSDPMHLLPDQAPLKHTLVTAGNDGTDLFDIAVGLDKPTTITPMPGGSGQIALRLDVGTITLGVQRRNHLQRQDSVQVIPAAQRTRQQGEEGALQVVLVRIRSGQWSQIVPVPFTRFAADSVSLWQGPEVNVPGARGALRLQLGNTRYALPVRITLERFDLDFYPGGRLLGATPRDFRSTLSIEDKQTGEPMVAVAHLNNPVYWPSGLWGGSWTFFQAQWDPQGQRWTILGVGNRHGTWLMLIGCVMIFAGLIYAFWCKPLIVRRMKANAIERARAAGRHVAAPQMAEAR